MTKKNLQAEVTVRVLGKDLTKAEAEELYAALGSALGKSPFIQYIYRDRPYWGGYQYNGNNQLIGGSITTTSGSGESITLTNNCAASFSSSMVELIEAEADGA